MNAAAKSTDDGCALGRQNRTRINMALAVGSLILAALGVAASQAMARWEDAARRHEAAIEANRQSITRTGELPVRLEERLAAIDARLTRIEAAVRPSGGMP